jgi:2-deoxy-D-gluconate 3-dehydrogenase
MGAELFTLDGRVALVTGGNRGLGQAMALGFKAARATVAVTGRNPEQNEVMGDELGAPHAVFSLDVRDEEAVERTIRQVVGRFGRLDILVNNAGIVRTGSILDTARETWEAVLGTNLTGAFLCARHAARVMIDRGEGGKIINIGSIYSLFGPPDLAGYGASKTGLLGLTRALAVELARHNIQVNAILPGYFETDMPKGMPDWLRRDIERKTPAGRWGRPQDLVGTAVYLASSASDYVTGAQITVDGGYAVADRFTRNE